jgi:acetyl esterase/lipase
MTMNLFRLTALCCLLAVCAVARGQAVPAQVPPHETPQMIEAAMAKYPPTQRDVVYGTANGTQLKLDVFEPKKNRSTPRKAILVIHGGSWDGYDKTILAPASWFFMKHGYVVFSINYRLVHDNQNHWPAQLDDAQRAVRWVRAHAQQYNIDPDHIGAFGHSAGAQIASFLGETDTRDNSDPELAKYSSRVQAVVDASGPTDFLAFRFPWGNQILENLMGMPANSDPAAWQAASPIWNVTPATSPFLVIHGKKDKSVYYVQSVTFVDVLRQAGVPVKFITTNDGHTYSTLWAKYKLAYGSKAFFRKTLGK